MTPIKVPSGLGPQRIVAAGDAVWSAGAGGLVRIDPETNAVEPRISGCIPSLVAAFGSVWAGERGGVLRVDPGTDDRVDEILTKGQELCGVSAADDSVWLGCGQDLYRVDPTTNEISATVRDVGADPGVVAAEGKAWVLSGPSPFAVASAEDASTTAERLDLATNRLIPRSTTRLVHGASVAARLHDGNVVWLSTSFGVGSGAGKLYAFEPASGAVRAAFDLGEGKGYGSNALAFAYGSLWTASGTANAVRRFAPPSP